MLQEGSVVKSLSGRDQQRFYVVVRLEGDFVWIADGKVRKLLAPKKKRVKHIARTNTVLDLAGVGSDLKLRKLLAPFNQP